jgi:hypothetical protein
LEVSAIDFYVNHQIRAALAHLLRDTRGYICISRGVLANEVPPFSFSVKLGFILRSIKLTPPLDLVARLLGGG